MKNKATVFIHKRNKSLFSKPELIDAQFISLIFKYVMVHIHDKYIF